MVRSNEINELANSLSKAQGEMPEAIFDSKNPHYKSDYASLSAFLKVVKPILSKHGLSVSQLPETINDKYCLTTILMHSSGQFISSSLPLLLSKNDMQGLGSAITYAKRYGIDAMLGVGSDDDDANLAVNKPIQTQVKHSQPPPPPFPQEENKEEKSFNLNNNGLSDAQMKRLRALQKAAGWQDSEVKTFLNDKLICKSSKDLDFEKYKVITQLLAKKTPFDIAINL